jgi:hypothetical protein
MKTSQHMSIDKICALILLVIYLALQHSTLDYGSKINDANHFKNYVNEEIQTKETALTKESIIDSSKKTDENIEKWTVRFKLYSIEADEMYSIMGLSRIKPHELQFDPHYYQYGGAFLYPLGVFYYILIKAGIVHISSFESLLTDPDAMDSVYFFGRLFVLLAFVLSACILYKTLLLLTTPFTSLLCLGIYLFAPISIMFSQVMKPHWYTLLWVNISLFLLVKLFQNYTWRHRDILLLSITLGLAVGSSSIIALYAVFVWFSLVYATLQKYIPWKYIIIIPIISIATFLLSNPYIILNHSAYILEMEAIDKWINLKLDGEYILFFIKNSLFSGVGITFSAVALLLIISQVIKPQKPVYRFISSSFIIIFLCIAFITADISYWHINLRYAPYLLPCLLLFTALVRWRYKTTILSIVFALTVIQSVPLIIAYHDENNPTLSTRLTSAAWIHENIPTDTTLTMDSIAPYNTPPIDYSAYTMIPSGGDYYVRFDRQMDFVHPPGGHTLVKRFQPRFSPESFPLVFSHINPQVSIYKKEK